MQDVGLVGLITSKVWKSEEHCYLEVSELWTHNEDPITSSLFATN